MWKVCPIYKRRQSRRDFSQDLWKTLENIFSKRAWNNKRIFIYPECLKHLRYIDDIVMIADMPVELQQAINVLYTTAKFPKNDLANTKLMYNDLI